MCVTALASSWRFGGKGGRVRRYEQYHLAAVPPAEAAASATAGSLPTDDPRASGLRAPLLPGSGKLLQRHAAHQGHRSRIQVRRHALNHTPTKIHNLASQKMCPRFIEAIAILCWLKSGVSLMLIAHAQDPGQQTFVGFGSGPGAAGGGGRQRADGGLGALRLVCVQPGGGQLQGGGPADFRPRQPAAGHKRRNLVI